MVKDHKVAHLNSKGSVCCQIRTLSCFLCAGWFIALRKFCFASPSRLCHIWHHQLGIESNINHFTMKYKMHAVQERALCHKYRQIRKMIYNVSSGTLY